MKTGNDKQLSCNVSDSHTRFVNFANSTRELIRLPHFYFPFKFFQITNFLSLVVQGLVAIFVGPNKRGFQFHYILSEHSSFQKFVLDYILPSVLE